MPHRALRCVWLGNLVRQRLDEPHPGKCKSARGFPASPGRPEHAADHSADQAGNEFLREAWRTGVSAVNRAYCQICTAAGQVHQRNVTVFADSGVDRSPCGSGTCARLAVLADQGRVTPAGPALRHESIVGSVFTGTVVAATTAAGRPAVVPQVTGMAYRTAEHTFVVDPADPLVPGFVLR